MAKCTYFEIELLDDGHNTMDGMEGENVKELIKYAKKHCNSIWPYMELYKYRYKGDKYPAGVDYYEYNKRYKTLECVGCEVF